MARRLPWILDDFWLTKDFNGPRGTVIEMGQHTGHPQVLRMQPVVSRWCYSKQKSNERDQRIRKADVTVTLSKSCSLSGSKTICYI